ncbi:MAG: GTP-binding protein [Candidatus Lokiarchaeota archaeon]
MSSNLIKGIIYIQFDDVQGTTPVIWIPDHLDEQLINLTGIKAISLLAGEKNFIPKNATIIPFPSRNKKGMIKFLKWRDESRRGGIGQSALAIVFNAVDDLIFYKYRDHLENIFDKVFDSVINKEKNHVEIESIKQDIITFEEQLTHVLEELEKEEKLQSKQKAFPGIGEVKFGDIDYKFKIVVCGDPGVGKTSSILRFTHNAFNRTYIPTLGVSISEKDIKIEDNIVELVLWDIAGQSKFQTMRTHFYQGTEGVLLVFDLSNYRSFENIENWFKDIAENTSQKYRIIGFIIGNKSDLIKERKVDRMEAENLANMLNLEYIETSALTGENIDNMFINMAQKILNSINMQ